MKLIKAYKVNQDSQELKMLETVFGEIDKVTGVPIGVIYWAEHDGKQLRHTKFICIEREDDAEFLVGLLNQTNIEHA